MHFRLFLLGEEPPDLGRNQPRFEALAPHIGQHQLARGDLVDPRRPAILRQDQLFEVGALAVGAKPLAQVSRSPKGKANFRTSSMAPISSLS